MIEIYNLNEKYEKQDYFDYFKYENKLKIARDKLQSFSFDEILGVWDSFGKKIIRDENLMQLEGVLYLAKWLSKDNLKNFVLDNLNLNDLNSNIKKLKGKGFVLFKPRGLLVHWVAGNTPTLPIFAIAQASLGRNSSILRASKRNIELTLKMLEILKKIEGPVSKAILENIIVVYFEHQDYENHKILSKIADCKVIWGGSDTVNFLKTLPEKENCECIIFGPKYSLAVIDSESLLEKDFSENLHKLAQDIIVFDQMACSSPQTIFCEKGKVGLKEIGREISIALDKVSKKYPKISIREDIASKIINKRNEYLLNPDLDVISSKNNDWTILLGGDFKLEEAVQSRTIFLKEVHSLEKIEELINPKIQTIGMIVKDKKKKIKLAERYYYKGASRCVSPGDTNGYDWPWDGMFVLDRMVRWCYLGE